MLSIDRLAQRGRVPRREQEAEGEGGVQLVGSEVAGQPVGALHPRLADEHPVAGVGVGEPSPRPVHLVDLVLIPVRVPLGAGPPASCRPARSGISGSLASPWATSTRKPSTPRSSQNRRMDSNSARTSGLRPVEVGLLGGEEVQVPLTGVRRLGHTRPGGSAEDALPVVRGLRRRRARARRGRGSAPARRCRARRRRAARNHGCSVGRVVRDEIDDDSKAEVVRVARRARRRRRGCRRAGRRRGSRRRRSRRRPAERGRRG